jgi:hypothetical protein
VPTGRIRAGAMPLGTALPAISIMSVSSMDMNIPAPGATRFVTERVQVTVLAANYESQKIVLAAVKHAAADTLYPTVPGIAAVTIHTDSAGPDFMLDDAEIYSGSQDFKVHFTQTR